MRTIKCDSCGYPYETKRANTKRCKVCQLIQRLTWLGKRTTKCEVEPEHYFVALTGHDKVCGIHDMLPRALDAEGECRRCNEFTTKLVHKDIAICRPCITKIENREWVLHKLRQKQAWQANRTNEAWDGVHAEV